MTEVNTLPRSNFYFRSIIRDDIPAVKELHIELFPVRYSEEFYDNLFQDKYYTILAFSMECHTLAGLATARVLDGDPKFPGACVDDVEGYIMTLGVASIFRRQGLGSQLLQKIVELMSYTARCDCISLHMKVGNTGALQLYQANDFFITEQLPQHYQINSKTYDALRLLYRTPVRGCQDRWTQCFSIMARPWVRCFKAQYRGGARLADRMLGKAMQPL